MLLKLLIGFGSKFVSSKGVSDGFCKSVILICSGLKYLCLDKVSLCFSTAFSLPWFDCIFGLTLSDILEERNCKIHEHGNSSTTCLKLSSTIYSNPVTQSPRKKGRVNTSLAPSMLTVSSLSTLTSVTSTSSVEPS